VLNDHNYQRALTLDQRVFLALLGHHALDLGAGPLRFGCALGDSRLARAELSAEPVDGLVKALLAGKGPVVVLLLRAEAREDLVVGLAQLSVRLGVALGLALASALLLQLVLEAGHLALELL